jgi:glycosyltransferase involved in cell wall biosynthesis
VDATTATVAHISVVICTRDRPDTIEQAVVSVLANTYASFDLMVIDQSRTMATEYLLVSIAEKDRRLTYVHVTETGLARARNSGIARTTGEIIAFTDDDCIVTQNWLSTIACAFGEDTQADLLYGQVFAPKIKVSPGSVTPSLTIPRAERLSRRDGFRIFGMGANFAARRHLFTSIGGFDEVLGAGGPMQAGEDFDLAYRTYLAGRAILLRPEIQVTHYGTRNPNEWQTTLRSYGIGDGAFYGKHIRCRDLFALRLLTQQLLVTSARVYAHRLLGHRRTEMTYVRYILIGIRKCFSFDIDSRSRLYVQRGGRRRGAGPESKSLVPVALNQPANDQ